MRKNRLMLPVALLMLSMVAQAQMLKCQFKNFKGNDDNVAVYYSPEGKSLADTAVPVKWAEDGSFTCDMDKDMMDVTIYVGDNGTLGAHLEKGKKVEMTITQESNGEFSAQFSGDNTAISAVVSKINDAYTISRYMPMGGEVPPLADNTAMLNRMHDEVITLLNGVNDLKLREEYAQLNEYCYKFMKIRLIVEDASETKKKPTDYPEYNAIVKDVNLNSDIAYRTYLSNLIINGYHKLEMQFGKDMGDYCREEMEICDKYVTNPKLRRTIVGDVAQKYFVYGDDSGDYRKFYGDMVKWAGADADLLKQYESVMASWEKTKKGGKAFDITLTDADGKTMQLLDVIKGKFAYIDVWATWCGPCKKEIPNFAKLAEKYNGQNDIIFISISVDENVNAWKKMINEEKPSWVQYNINGKENKQFSSDWGITGIPRFIMIDKNGNIFNADAARPSSEDAEEILKSIQ